MMREKLWLRVVSNVPENQILPWWALAARAVLYPLDFILWRVREKCGYQPATDTWVINGVKYSGRSLFRLAHADGETYRVTRSGDTVIFERVPRD